MYRIWKSIQIYIKQSATFRTSIIHHVTYQKLSEQLVLRLLMVQHCSEPPCYFSSSKRHPFVDRSDLTKTQQQQSSRPRWNTSWGNFTNMDLIFYLKSWTITDCFNNIFETRENLEINSGDMITPPNLENLKVLLKIWDHSPSWIPSEKLYLSSLKKELDLLS